MENQNPQQNHERPEEIHHKIDGFKVFLAILAIVLVISNVITVYFLLNKDNDEVPKQELPIVSEPIIDDTIDPIIEEEGEDNNVELAANEIFIDWEEEKLSIEPDSIFNTEDVQAYIDSDSSYRMLKNVQDFYDWVELYKIGEIKNSDNPDYINSEVYMASLLYEGPGFGTVVYRFVKKNDDLYLLQNYSYDIAEPWLNSLVDYIDEKTIISNISTPEILDIPNSAIKLKKFEDTPLKELDTFMSEYSNHELLFTKDNYDVYKAYNCIITATPDDAVYYYTYDLDFNYNKQPSRLAQPLDITWSNGTKNDDSFYLYHRYSMSGSACYSYADTFNITDLSKLKIAGTTPSGDKIYELKDANVKISPKNKNSILEDWYSQFYVPEGEEKISFEDYVASHPLIFWQDPFGEFIYMENSTYARAVEMGKPVIYLYPEKTTDVAVKVFPNKGLTITDPIYNDGWFVKASPNGSLYNYNDGQTYPYLFWEGLGIDYKMPKDGFVVDKADVEKFLIEKLSKQGLIPNEYNEFIEFWAPRMQEKPYYFITFISQQEFDKLAPLEVSPQPDTIIRVFMDYKGLEKQIEVSPQVFETPQRNGFTVVEWGGALHN